MNKVLGNILDNIQCRLPKKLAHTIIHFRFTKRLMPWKNPQTYDEKVRWLMVNHYTEEESRYVDKARVRDYVKECGLEQILVPCCGVWKSSSEIDVDSLPQRFILKTTNGTGPDCYAIIKDKADKQKLDAALIKMDRALKNDQMKKSCSYLYLYFEPQIIGEVLLDDGNERMTDYKILCFDGHAQFILVCSDRDEGRDYFDREWNYLEFTKPEYRSPKKIVRPKNLDLMLQYAEILSKPFIFVRVDFYNLNGKIYFGEITLTPSAGYTGNLTEEAEKKIGSMIHLPA